MFTSCCSCSPACNRSWGTICFTDRIKPAVVTVNGGRGRSNNYSVNGGDGNDLFANLPAVQPSPDSIEEFRVITNSFDAEYGRNSGAVVNVVTKSGTNEFHGSVFEFFRNTVLNAKPFTLRPDAKPDFQQNQFGGTLGGPIKKDKTFFFGSYEGRRIKPGHRFESGATAQQRPAQQRCVRRPDGHADNGADGQHAARALRFAIVRTGEC